MRILLTLALLLCAATLAPGAAADHLPVDEPVVPQPGALAVRCVVSSSTASACATLQGRNVGATRVSLYGPAAAGATLTPRSDPARPGVAAFAFRASTGTAAFDASAGDHNGDGVPDGLRAGPSVGVGLLGGSRLGASLTLVDRSGDGIPETPTATSDVGGLPPTWLPSTPNTPYPLPPVPPLPKV